MRMLIILWLASLSAGTAAFIGGRAAWRLRFQGHRTEYGIAWALALWAFSAAKFATTYNSIIGGPRNQAINFLAWQVIWSNLEALGIWIIALTLMNGRQGWVRRQLTALLERMEGKEIEMTTDDNPNKPQDPPEPQGPPEETPPVDAPPVTPAGEVPIPPDPNAPPPDPPGGGG